MIHKIPFPSLLTELQDFANDYSKKLFEQKVDRVYVKCLRRGKTELAKRIKTKYKGIINKLCYDDRVMAFALTILTSNKEK